MAITHQYQGNLRRLQLLILGAFLIALVVVGTAWRHSTNSSTKAAVTTAVVAFVGHAGFARDLYSVQVSTTPHWPAWALFWEHATPQGLSTFQDTYGVAEKQRGNWKLIDWGTALVGCVQPPVKPTIPALVMKDLGMACPRGWV